MSDKKNMTEALEHFKAFRNTASEMSGVQIDFFAKFIKAATEGFSKPEVERSFTDKSLVEAFRFLSDDIDASLNSLDKFNKSVDEYLKGHKKLKIAIGGEKDDL